MSVPLAHTAADDATMLAGALESLAGAVRELAHKVDDLGEPRPPGRLTRRLESLPLRPFLVHRMASIGIHTVADLLAQREDLQHMRFRNVGAKTMLEIWSTVVAALAADA